MVVLGKIVDLVHYIQQGLGTYLFIADAFGGFKCFRDEALVV